MNIYKVVILLLVSLSSACQAASRISLDFKVKGLSPDRTAVLFETPVKDLRTKQVVDRVELNFPYCDERLDFSQVAMVLPSSVTVLKRGQHLLVGPLSMVALAVTVASDGVEVACLPHGEENTVPDFIKHVTSTHKPEDFRSMFLHTNRFDSGFFLQGSSNLFPKLDDESKRAFLRSIKDGLQQKGYPRGAIKGCLGLQTNWSDYTNSDFIGANEWALVFGDTDASSSIHSVCPPTSLLDIFGVKKPIEDRYALLEEMVAAAKEKVSGKKFHTCDPVAMLELLPIAQQRLKNRPSDLELLTALVLQRLTDNP